MLSSYVPIVDVCLISYCLWFIGPFKYIKTDSEQFSICKKQIKAYSNIYNKIHITKIFCTFIIYSSNRTRYTVVQKTWTPCTSYLWVVKSGNFKDRLVSIEIFIFNCFIILVIYTWYVKIALPLHIFTPEAASQVCQELCWSQTL